MRFSDGQNPLFSSTLGVYWAKKNLLAKIFFSSKNFVRNFSNAKEIPPKSHSLILILIF
jgi:hypothetical protein